MNDPRQGESYEIPPPSLARALKQGRAKGKNADQIAKETGYPKSHIELLIQQGW